MTFTIGILGGIASGKSTVTQLLAERGAVVLDADAAAHAVLQEPDVAAAMAERWGRGVVDAAGQVDRKAVASKIFSDGPDAEADRAFAESLIHPRVRSRLLSERATLIGRPDSVAVLDVPLLLEVGWHTDCDLLVFVSAPNADRRARAAQRGWTDQELAKREAAQAPISEKRAAAQEVIENSGSIDDLRGRVARLWDERVRPLLEENRDK
ncbi:Dephospho-CoA kinase [Pirellulimonas nuda]|uniref:Dephospho-CoA kinase n=1 Tax=Pirellulimonas nuda TaxID=2528009 RepID=A0A518DAY0_9BACT|nr:dephospho-CoA kinase [Pirellulimonas nuda]QDU88639.1 Dephospho-CoA kinase [Pirellulimonas nuda]